MPLDITVKNKNGKITRYTIPLDIMRGIKKGDRFFEGFKVAPDWTWSHPTYSLELEDKINDIQSIEIDSSQRLADVDRENNLFPRLLPQEGMDK
jgi:hypothetical protein